MHLLAIRTLVVRKFHDLHGSALRATPGSIGDVDFRAGLAQLNDHAKVASQSGDVGSARFGLSELPHGVENVGPDRLIGFFSTQAFVIKLKLIFGRLLNLDGDMTLE